MKQDSLRVFLVLSAIGLFSMRFPGAPSVSSPFSVTFRALNVAAGPVFSVSLDLVVSVGVTPFLLLPGGSASLDVGVIGQTGNVSVTYQGNTYSKEFVTPIGSVKIPVADVALGSLYANVTGRVQTTPEVKGAATVSPTTYSWVSEGSQSISVNHHISAYSLFLIDVVAVELPLEYVSTVIVGVEALGNTVLEYSANVGSLAGSPTITQDLSTFPVGTLIVPVAVVAVAVRYWREKRKRKKAAQKTQTNSRRLGL